MSTHSVKAVHKHQREIYKHLLENIEQHKPKEFTLHKHPEGKAPKEIAPGVHCMAGDYYSTDHGQAFVVPAHDVENESGIWETV